MKKVPYLSVAEFALLFAFSVFPLFFDLSYQFNLYLTWEGAYRLANGEVPYRDFGMPMGFCYWIVPALFFKLLGPSLITLAKAQAFLNIVSALSFRWIMIRFGASAQVRLLSLLVFCLTFVMGIAWPQYNHSVIIFQFIAFGFLFEYLLHDTAKRPWISLTASAFFFAFAFFTKQDAGGLAILIALALVAYHSFALKSVKPGLLFIGLLTAFFLLFILPFTQYGFGYWFNYGQFPHNSRISIQDILGMIMKESRWEKIYLAVVLGFTIIRIQRKEVFDRKEIILTLFTLGILTQALIFQVTSYVPKDNNIFFHAFFCFYAFYQLDKLKIFELRFAFPVLFFLVGLWWSEKYWNYAERVIAKLSPPKPMQQGEVSINTYILQDSSSNHYADLSTWKLSPLRTFSNVKMPVSTIEGIDRLLPVIRAIEGPKVLNMSELTPLASEVPFALEKGGPLWFHLGVGMFDRELQHYRKKIEGNFYDVVIFEYIPNLNNFYAFPVRDYLKANYKLIDSFEAPRAIYHGTIEVYTRRSPSN